MTVRTRQRTKHTQRLSGLQPAPVCQFHGPSTTFNLTTQCGNKGRDSEQGPDHCSHCRRLLLAGVLAELHSVWQTQEQKKTKGQFPMQAHTRVACGAEQCSHPPGDGDYTGNSIFSTGFQPCLLFTGHTRPWRHEPMLTAGVPAKPSLQGQNKGKMLLKSTCQPQAKRSSGARCIHCQQAPIVL